MTHSPAYIDEAIWTRLQPQQQQNFYDCGVYVAFTAYVWLHYHDPLHFPWRLFAIHTFTNSFCQFIAKSLWEGSAPHLRGFADLPSTTPSLTSLHAFTSMSRRQRMNHNNRQSRLKPQLSTSQNYHSHTHNHSKKPTMAKGTANGETHT